MKYYPTFSLADFSISVSGTDAGVYYPVYAGGTSASFACHLPLTAIPGGTLSDVGFPYAVGALSQSWSAMTLAGFNINYNDTTMQYTIANPGGAFSISWSETTRVAFGFTGSLSGASSYTSHVRPYYVIAPAIEARSGDSGPYEPDDIVKESVSDGGTAFLMSMDTIEIRRDWTQPFESHEASQTNKATTAVPWTWQDFFKHCRSLNLPFLVTDENLIYTLRAEGAVYGTATRTRVAADWDSLWNIKLMTREYEVTLP
jgi:hypothetical protein